ncbi:hypothetical protein [Cryobacterium sp. Y11]|uniref:hypothetical protein n=1 Tax=Cryobacterium sp. Y11 TaxID=2045016 RepID=UPI0011B0B404|nr:hypothetical protein [Cryobacterium sp. Y11]
MYIRLWQRLLSASIIGVVVLAAAITVLLLMGGDLRFAGWAALIFYSTLLMQSAQIPLRARGLMGWVSLIMIFDRLVFLAVILALTALGVGGEVAIPIGLASGITLDAFLCFLSNRRMVPARDGSGMRIHVGHPKRWFLAWRGATGYGVAAVLGSAQQLDMSILGFSSGPAAAGSYGAVSRWTTPLLLPSTALTQVGMAHAPKAASTRLTLWEFRRVVWILILAMVGAIGVAHYSDFIAPAILGTQYAGSSPIFALLALSIIPTLFAQPLSMILQSRGEEVHVAWVLGGGLAIRLSTCFVLGASLGGLAGAWGVLLQQSFILVVLILVIAKVLVREAKIGKQQSR